MIRPGDADWLERRAGTLFRLDSDGCILLDRDPSQTPPRLFVQRSDSVVAFNVRADLPDSLVSELTRLAGLEPPAPPGAPLVQAEALQDRLGAIAPPAGGPVFAIPANGDAPGDPALIRSGTEIGRELVGRWRREGLPRALSDLGFIDADDVWAPWVLVMHDGGIAALCQTARLSNLGAEAGVITAPTYRRRGFGALVTRAWAAHPDLNGRTLYYSTSHANLASRALARTLGLAQPAEDWRFV